MSGRFSCCSQQESDEDEDERRENNSRLFSAIRKNKSVKVKELLEAGVKTSIVDKNNKNNTPLHYAVEKGNKEIVAELLNPKWRTNTNLKNLAGNTPLNIAIKKNNEQIVQLLRNHSTQVSAVKNQIEMGESSNAVINKNEDEGCILLSNLKTGNISYNKTKGAAGIGGQFYEINLATLLLLKGKTDEQIVQFYLASNMKEADKLDDIVFTYETELGQRRITFLQAKHKTSLRPSITLQNVLSASETGDFSLNKYFISYRKIRQCFSDEKYNNHPVFGRNFEDSEFLIYTNGVLETGHRNCIHEIEINNDLLKITGSQGKCYQLDYNSDKKGEIYDSLKDSSDCKRLAKALAVAFCGKGIDVQKEIFENYHSALKNKVFQKTVGLKGKLKDEFLTSSNKFRDAFFAEVGENFNKNTEIPLSEKFWKEIGGSCDLPTDDPIHENEIEDFLKKLKFYTSQPNEKMLEKTIKETIKELYQVRKEDAKTVFAQVKYKVAKWWQFKNNYLTKDNRFIERAVRISIEYDVLDPVPSFTGRLQEVEDLHGMLQESGKVVITGLGGIGKSELAREYLRKYKHEYDNNAFWINAESRGTLAESFFRIAQNILEMSTTDRHGNRKDSELLTKQVYKFFAKTHRKSVFVFDNAENSSVCKFLPSGNEKPYVILTSRYQNWQEINVLALGLFSNQEAEDFIKKGLTKTMDENEVERLAEELGYLPLALKQAVAYISFANEERERWYENKEYTITNYLKEFNENADKLLSEGVDEDRYTKTVMTTWKTTTDKIKHQNEPKSNLALNILNTLAYLSPDKIPKDVLYGTHNDENQVRCAVEILEQYSMVSLVAGNCSIQRLLQKTIRLDIEQQGNTDEIIKHTFKLLKNCVNHFLPNDHFQNARMIPHLKTFQSHLSDTRYEMEKKYINILLSWMEDNPNHEKSKKLLKEAVEIMEILCGPDSFETAFTLVDVANAYGHLQDSLLQKQLMKRALAIQENHYGSQHFQVASTLVHLGCAYGGLSGAQKKKDFLERALSIQETYYGPDHFKVAHTLENLACAYGDLGYNSKKHELLVRVLKIKENHYGPDHVQLAITLENIADVYDDLEEKFLESLLLHQVWAIRRNYEGSDIVAPVRKNEKDYVKKKKCCGCCEC